MTTLSSNRHGRTPGGVPRSGGRTTERRGFAADSPGTEQRELVEHPVVGAVALASRARVVPQAPGDSMPDTGEAGPGPGLRVAPPALVRTPRTPFIVMVLLLVVAGVIGILVLNTKINENVFRLHDLQQTQATLDTQEQQLETDLAERAAPGTVAGKARELGMQLPTKPPTFIVLPDGRRLGVPQPAVGN
ncbi:MAG: hypothetical protein HKP61_18640 [Dactylosporangium sp.]|nr:YhcB family protein [Dactylosporangium sp.]NNJ62908.1 hypothetical protein [Dactylosporangium sp.]